MGQDVDNLKALSKYAEACTECGNCRVACDLLDNHNLSIGQVAGFISEGNISKNLCEMVRQCDLCDYCTRECPSELSANQVISGARSCLVARGESSLEGFETMFVDRDWNAFSLYRATYNIDYGEFERDQYDSLFFPGCSLASFAPEITRAVYWWLKGRGVSLGFTDMCCGKPLESLGLHSRSTELQQQLLAQVQAAGARRIVTVCPSCHHVLAKALEGVEIVSLYRLLREAGISLSGTNAITIHDSCGDRDQLETASDLRSILRGHLILEMEHSGRDTICCGAGGIVPATDPELCTKRSRRRVEEFERTGAVSMVTACMACSRRLSESMQKGQVRHALELIYGVELDYGQINRNRDAMWEGEAGELNELRLANAEPLTQEGSHA